MQNTKPVPTPPRHSLNEIIEKMWIQALATGLCLFIAWIGYLLFQKNPFTFNTVSIALAATAAVLIGLSFVWGSLAFYNPFFDKELAERKYFGLTGYGFALAHACSLLLLNPQTYWFGLSQHIFTPDISLGLLAMLILTWMTAISNNWATKKLGGKHWRWGLRLGYVAYGLLIIRAANNEGSSWIQWIINPQGLPPLRLLIAIFATLIIGLRLAVLIEEVLNTFFSNKQPLPHNQPVVKH